MSYLTSADAGAVVTGVKQNGAYRTNIGFAAGEDGASYSLTLRSANGGVVSTATGSLGVFGWTQPNVGSLFAGTSIPDDGQLTVKVTAGSLDVYDSSTDAGSGDPVITRIAPLPADIPSQASIGPAGGSIRSADGRLTLKIPAGALATSTSLSIANSANGAPQGVGSGYTVAPGGLSLAKPALLVLNYGPGDTAGSSPGSLGLAFQNGGKWYVATGGSADTAGRTLTVPLTSTTFPASARASLSLGTLQDPAQQLLFVSPYESLVMNPTKAAVLQRGGEVSFTLWYTGPSSSGVALTLSAPPELLESFVPPGWLYSWYVNGVLLGNDAEGYLTETGPGSVYTAPGCIPSANPVLIAVEVIDPTDPNANFRRPRAVVRVLPTIWLITWENGTGVSCGSTLIPQDISYMFWSTAKAGFLLSDELRVDFNPATDRQNPTKEYEQLRFCESSPDCTFTMGDFDAAEIKSVTGAFDVDADKLHVEIGAVSTGTPALTASCPKRFSKTYPKAPGSPFPSPWPFDVPITSFGHVQDDSFDIGGIRGISIMTVKPDWIRCD
jgi:hypothetical protein